MPIKSCCYYDCSNYILTHIGSANLTMFAFPKDEERRKEWIMLAKVQNYDSNSQNFLCSEHFDPKYIGIIDQRSVLFGSANPYPCTSILANTNVDEIDGQEMIKMMDLCAQQVESTKKQSDTTNVSLTGKRSTTDLTPCNKKKPKLPLMCEEVDTSIKTTTFILNGEECIQMPKSVYLEEKMKLIKEIECYKKFTSQIDSNLTELLEDI